MTPPVTIHVTLREGRPSVSQTPDGTVQAEARLEGRYLRVALRGPGDVEVRFEGVPVRDADIRGGYALVLPGSPYVVRAKLEGWLSVTAVLEQPRNISR